MWAAICTFFGALAENFGRALSAIFSFLKSQKDSNKADFDAVVKTQNEIITHQGTVILSMQNRIDVMDKEFQKAMERRDEEQKRTDARIYALEGENDECRKRLGNALTQVADLRGKLKLLMIEKEEAERIRSLKEDKNYQRDTIAQVRTLLDHEGEKQTKVEP